MKFKVEIYNKEESDTLINKIDIALVESEGDARFLIKSDIDGSILETLFIYDDFPVLIEEDFIKIIGFFENNNEQFYGYIKLINI